MKTTILLTGIAGFMGSAYARHVLETTDWNIVGLDRLDEAGALSRIPSPNWGRVQFIWHDLRSPINAEHHAALRQPFRYVVHMAAASHVDRSVRDPMGFIMDNVVGTGNLLEFARHLPEQPQKILYFSTDEVFGPATDEPFDEFSPHTPANAYAATKSAAEQLCPAWANTWDMPITITHCTNIVGEGATGLGQHAEKYIPKAIATIRSGAVLQIHARDGVPSSRYYVHHDDVARAVQVILERGGVLGGAQSGRYNIGGLEELSNLLVAQKLAALLDKPLNYELVDFVASRPRHDQRYALNSSRLEALGWKPEIGIDECLRRCVLSTNRAQPA